MPNPLSTIPTAENETTFQECIVNEQVVVQQPEVHRLRCYLCGHAVTHNHTSDGDISNSLSSAAKVTTMCLTCLQADARNQARNLIPRSAVIKFCKTCNRYSDTHAKGNNPSWRVCEWESRELLGLCLTSLNNSTLGNGSKTDSISDAQFLYTEPHSRRIKVKLTANRQVSDQVIIKQSHVVEFVMKSQQCPDCAREYTPHTWNCLVQIRQHKAYSPNTTRRMFAKLEQLLLKKCENKLVSQLVKAEINDELADFFFRHRMHATEFEHFIRKHFVIKKNACKLAKSLVSVDVKSAKYNFKYTRCLELAPIVRWDLVVVEDFKQLMSHSTKIKDSGALRRAGVLLCIVCHEGKLEFVDTVTGKNFILHDWKGLKTIADKSCMKQFTVLNLESGNINSELGYTKEEKEEEEEGSGNYDMEVEGENNDNSSTIGRNSTITGRTHGSIIGGKSNISGFTTTTLDLDMDLPKFADVARTSDLGTTDDGLFIENVRVSHIAKNCLQQLEVSDTIWGYDLRCLNRPELDCLMEEEVVTNSSTKRSAGKINLPEVILCIRQREGVKDEAGKVIRERGVAQQRGGKMKNGGGFRHKKSKKLKTVEEEEEDVNGITTNADVVNGITTNADVVVQDGNIGVQDTSTVSKKTGSGNNKENDENIDSDDDGGIDWEADYSDDEDEFFEEAD